MIQFVKMINMILLISIFFASYADGQKEKLTGDYLGQTPPGIIPKLFAPGIISTNEDEYAFEISSSGNEIVFIRNNKIMLLTMNSEGIWSNPIVAPFSGKFIDDEPCFAPNGKKVYFVSRRNCPGSKHGANLWATSKSNGNWSEPKPVQITGNSKQIHAPSVAANGNIYDDGIRVFRYKNNKYQPAEIILPSSQGMYPFISPDESYMIFAARPPGKNNFDLFVSFRNSDNTWSQGISLGDQINSSANEGNSFVTSDGKYLFFSRNFDIYWVDAKIVTELKPY